jgi:hypothetical protein
MERQGKVALTSKSPKKILDPSCINKPQPEMQAPS